jgi:hypothetical protein
MTVMGASAVSGMTGIAILGLIVIMVWEVIWKGIGLWHSAGNKQKGWFVAILILNTLGLLPIIYLLWFKRECEDCKIKITPVKNVVKKRTAKRRKK